MKNYEIMYVLMPNLDADAIKKEIESLHKILSDNGAKITGVNEWGMRDLAYPIKEQVKGYYVVTALTGEKKAVEEFDRIARLDQKVVRFLVTVAQN
jgi:small subunit ribosomal protein S6